MVTCLAYIVFLIPKEGVFFLPIMVLAFFDNRVCVCVCMIVGVYGYLCVYVCRPVTSSLPM